MTEKMMKSVSCFSVLTTLALAASTVLPAHAQWTLTNLHPAGSVQSECIAVEGGQQVGSAFFRGPAVTYEKPGLWTGTAASWVDLDPNLFFPATGDARLGHAFQTFQRGGDVPAR